MDSEISLYTKTFKDVFSIPTISSAVILPGQDEGLLCVHSNWCSQDLVSMEKTGFSRDYTLSFSQLDVLSSGFPYHNSPITFSSFSKSGRRRAILTEKKSPEATYLEIWNKSKRESTFDLTDSKHHGKIPNNACFGDMVWSANEHLLLFVAEAKQHKSVSFFKESLEGKEDDGKSPKGEEYLYREEWGEQLVGCHHTVLCVMDVESGQVEVMPTHDMSPDISVGQAVWGPKDETIIFEGWLESPRRLGLLYCQNRRSALYSVNLQSKEIESITGDDNCVRSPRFSPHFETLLYLENDSYGPHKMCSKLQKFDLKTKKHSTLVDIVDHAVGDEFPGIYANFLPKRCWSQDGKYVFFSDFWRSCEVIKCVAVEGHKSEQQNIVQKIDAGDSFGSCSILDIHKDVILAQVAAPNCEPCLVAGFLKFGDKVSVDWKFLDENTPVKHSDVTWDLITLESPTSNILYPLDYEIILLKPKETTGKIPLIIVPHGGPHSTYPPVFPFRMMSYVKLNYAVCLVNYRGSLGFGNYSVTSLPCMVGVQDVADVQNAATHVKDNCGLDVGDVFFFGGSHGGFLGAHLAGQYPDFYKAVCLLNPVVDMCDGYGSSDIPDWMWVESGVPGKYDPSKALSIKTLELMWKVSPMRYAESVQSPVLLLIGKNDLRVPPKQGLKYYHILKARNVPTRLHLYDDNHPLGKTPHDSDAFMQCILWFSKHSSSNKSSS